MLGCVISRGEEVQLLTIAENVSVMRKHFSLPCVGSVLLEPVGLLISEESRLSSRSPFSFGQGNKSVILPFWIEDCNGSTYLSMISWFDEMKETCDYSRDSHFLSSELSGRNNITCMQKLHMNNIMKIFSSITSGSFLRDPGIPPIYEAAIQSHGLYGKIFLTPTSATDDAFS